MKLKIKFLKWIIVASWKDDLQFFVLFNCVSVISGRRKGDYERLWGETSFMVGKISASTRTWDYKTSRPVLNPLIYRGHCFIKHVHIREVSSSMCTNVKFVIIFMFCPILEETYCSSVCLSITNLVQSRLGNLWDIFTKLGTNVKCNLRMCRSRTSTVIFSPIF